MDDIQQAGVRWVGIQVDTGFGTKLRDRMVVEDCAPLSFKELEEIRNRVSVPLLDYLPHPLQVMDEVVSVVKGKHVVMVGATEPGLVTRDVLISD